MESTHPLSNDADGDRHDYVNGPATLANPEPQRAEDGRLMYFEHQVQPRPGHWLLERLTVDELRAALVEALDATMVADPARMIVFKA